MAKKTTKEYRTPKELAKIFVQERRVFEKQKRNMDDLRTAMIDRVTWYMRKEPKVLSKLNLCTNKGGTNFYLKLQENAVQEVHGRLKLCTTEYTSYSPENLPEEYLLTLVKQLPDYKPKSAKK